MMYHKSWYQEHLLGPHNNYHTISHASGYCSFICSQVTGGHTTRLTNQLIHLPCSEMGPACSRDPHVGAQGSNPAQLSLTQLYSTSWDAMKRRCKATDQSPDSACQCHSLALMKHGKWSLLPALLPPPLPRKVQSRCNVLHTSLPFLPVPPSPPPPSAHSTAIRSLAVSISTG